ncbi:hypothetical protein BDQ94DRAFT_154894 [Aspergillus welwitschiae]|uniref:Zn(2)-C6 fungal-type domain-containing protein n=1 Tax=Aspergillus welwitschiae TaxID=1341132 RepID=A0A3F3PKG3_9EURO|nr:hypothetical protein BDQ94DRAFT_154894 [Aspergillus welwitschiae]RDH26846.1 hypothetical protein BDQ94DRAFT_154894 [Aspergillus welwitschiae]
MTENVRLRQLRPATEAPYTEPIHRGLTPNRRNTACTMCRRKRRKCTGTPICLSCMSSRSECIFEPHKDKRRKAALRHAEKNGQKLAILLERLLTFLKIEKDETVLQWKRSLNDILSPDMMIAKLERDIELGLGSSR